MYKLYGKEVDIKLCVPVCSLPLLVDELVIIEFHTDADEEPGPLERSGLLQEGMAMMAINGEWNRGLSFEEKRMQIKQAQGFVTFRFRKPEFMSDEFQKSLVDYRRQQDKEVNDGNC